jgi:LysR family nitrogen assimilation transcriptional regulator
VDIRHLRYFIRIVDLKSFARAAAELHVAQSALGLHIRNLERELKVRLLTRHSRGVEPTEAGIVLHGHAIKIVQNLEQAREAVQTTAAATRSRLLLGVTPPIQRSLMITLARQNKAELRNVDVCVVDGTSQSLVELVCSGKMSACCAYNIGDHDGFECTKVLDDELVFVRRRGPKRVKPTISFADLVKHPLALPPMPHSLRKLLEGAAKRRGMSLNVTFESLSLSAVRELVQHGLAAAVLPFGAVACDVEDRRFEIRRIVNPILSMPLSFLHADRHGISRVGTVVETTLRSSLAHEIADARTKWMRLHHAGRNPPQRQLSSRGGASIGRQLGSR